MLLHLYCRVRYKKCNICDNVHLYRCTNYAIEL